MIGRLPESWIESQRAPPPWASPRRCPETTRHRRTSPPPSTPASEMTTCANRLIATPNASARPILPRPPRPFSRCCYRQPQAPLLLLSGKSGCPDRRIPELGSGRGSGASAETSQTPACSAQCGSVACAQCSCSYVAAATTAPADSSAYPLAKRERDAHEPRLPVSSLIAACACSPTYPSSEEYANVDS